MVGTGDDTVLVSDQRGAPYRRFFDWLPGGNVVDVGAYEFQLSRDVLVVSTAVDENDGDDSAGDVSLREAIIAANAIPNGPEPDTITFSSSLAGQNITLGGKQLTVTEAVSIDGPGAGQLTISGNDQSRILDFIAAGPASFAIDGVTLTAGPADGESGGPIRLADSGNMLAITNRIIHNSFAAIGGGIHVNGSRLLLSTSSIVNNSAAADGGRLSLQNANESWIVNSTLSGNQAVHGGGVDHSVTAAGRTSRLTIVHSTFANQTASEGAAIRNSAITGAVSATVSLANSIVANNSGSDNFSNTGDTSVAAITSLGHNLSDDASGPLDPALNDLMNTDPLLGTLQLNNGSTPTFALMAGSPAIDAGDNALTKDAAGKDLNFDQRGDPLPRILDGNNDLVAVVDLGAYERFGMATIILTESGGGTSVAENGGTDVVGVTLNQTPLNGDVMVNFVSADPSRAAQR